jgi:hypothetical protein
MVLGHEKITDRNKKSTNKAQAPSAAASKIKSPATPQALREQKKPSNRPQGEVTLR